MPPLHPSVLDVVWTVLSATWLAVAVAYWMRSWNDYMNERREPVNEIRLQAAKMLHGFSVAMVVSHICFTGLGLIALFTAGREDGTPSLWNLAFIVLLFTAQCTIGVVGVYLHLAKSRAERLVRERRRDLLIAMRLERETRVQP